MSFIKSFTFVLVASSFLVACSSYNQSETDNKTSVTQIKDSNALIHSIKPSSSEAIIGQVTGIIMQDREQQKVTIMAQDGQSYTVSMNKTNLGQQNAYHMQKLAVDDYIEVTGEQSQLDNDKQINVTTMPYVLRQIIVADHKVDCVGVGPQSCLLTKPAGQTGNQSDWQYRYSGIEGFDYLPNYEYTLLIKNTPVSNPPADASSVRSQLVKIIEKKSTKR